MQGEAGLGTYSSVVSDGGGGEKRLLLVAGEV